MPTFNPTHRCARIRLITCPISILAHPGQRPARSALPGSRTGGPLGQAVPERYHVRQQQRRQRTAKPHQNGETQHALQQAGHDLRGERALPATAPAPAAVEGDGGQMTDGRSALSAPTFAATLRRRRHKRNALKSCSSIILFFFLEYCEKDAIGVST